MLAILLTGIALATSTGAGPGLGIDFDVEQTPPSGAFDGAFDQAPVVQWKVRLPGPRLNSATHSEYTQPLVVGDVLFVGSAAGSALYMLSRRDGGLIRSFPAASTVESGAAVYDEKVYFADTGGYVWCYGFDGELLWTHKGNAPVLVRPTIHEGKVFVTNVDDLAVSLDALTGELEWRYQAKVDLTREAELALYAAPPAVITGDDVLLGFSDGSLVAVDWRSGELRWQRRVGEGRYPDLVAEPVPFGDDLYTSGYFKPLVALDEPSRDVRWRVDAGAASAVAVDDSSGTAVIYHPSSNGKLRAISALTGAEKWLWDSGHTGALTTPVPTPAGLVVASSDAGIYLIDSVSGKELWRFHEDFILLGISAAPVVAGRQLFFVSNAGTLYAMIAPGHTEPPRELWD